ncbi:MAG: toll/interleukin-1 receptor domain-containing protein [Dehalococcoidia bacterium]
MANRRHVAVVRKGAEAIAEWLRSNPGARLDLSGADLSGADLFVAHLPGADLGGAKLTGAMLRGALLLAADLTGADLTRADLSDANLVLANVTRAKLCGVDLSGVSLVGANVTAADLTQANLRQANLPLANLFMAVLSRADLSQAGLGHTCLSGVDLSDVIGLATVTHDAPSSVGVDTLIASFRGAGNRLTPELVTFFRGAGVPQELLEALPGIVAEVKYYSCFIAYGEPDVEFARKLCQDLEATGVSCWLYDMDKTPGERIWGEIERKLEEYERMVVLCSIDALMREGVKREIDKQIDKNPDKLVPVSLEKRWTYPGFEARWGSRDVKTWLLERNYADFAGWESDPSRYEKGLEELLRGLRRKRVRRRRA